MVHNFVFHCIFCYLNIFVNFSPDDWWIYRCQWWRERTHEVVEPLLHEEEVSNFIDYAVPSQLQLVPHLLCFLHFQELWWRDFHISYCTWCTPVTNNYRLWFWKWRRYHTLITAVHGSVCCTLRGSPLWKLAVWNLEYPQKWCIRWFATTWA